MRTRIKKILCPIDFSDAAIKAISFSAELAKAMDASMTIWNIQEIPIIEGMSFNKLLKDKSPKEERELNAIMNEWSEEIKEEYQIECIPSYTPNINSLDETLSHYIDGQNFDLIVVGTNGVGDNHRFFFEHSSYNILNRTKCPILFVPDTSN